MTPDEKRAALRSLSDRPGIMTGRQLVELRKLGAKRKDDPQLSLFDVRPAPAAIGLAPGLHYAPGTMATRRKATTSQRGETHEEMDAKLREVMKPRGLYAGPRGHCSPRWRPVPQPCSSELQQ